MKRLPRSLRWPLALMVVVVLGLLVWFEPTHVIRGWLRGEAFYQGRPTSYWSAEIERWEWDGRPVSYYACMGTKTYRRRSIWPQPIAKLLPAPATEWPTLLDGDPAGIPVLVELSKHGSPHVSEWAEEAIDRVSSGEKGPGKTDYLLGKQRPHSTPTRVHGSLEP